MKNRKLHFHNRHSFSRMNEAEEDDREELEEPIDDEIDDSKIVVKDKDSDNDIEVEFNDDGTSIDNNESNEITTTEILNGATTLLHNIIIKVWENIEELGSIKATLDSEPFNAIDSLSELNSIISNITDDNYVHVGQLEKALSIVNDHGVNTENSVFDTRDTIEEPIEDIDEVGIEDEEIPSEAQPEPENEEPTPDNEEGISLNMEEVPQEEIPNEEEEDKEVDIDVEPLRKR